MSTTTEAPAADLSRLTSRERLNVAVAQSQGWVVRITDEDDEPHFEAGELVGLPPDWRERDIFFEHLLEEEGEDVGPDVEHWDWLPNYAGDPAAWGALMEGERIGVDSEDIPGGGVRWIAWRTDVDESPLYGADSPGQCICAAVLARAGVDPTPYIGD